jgi:hypothetical protein
MVKKKESFLKILIIELEDLDDDIKLLIKECDERHCRQEITDYVFMENLAVLRNELFGVEGFVDDIKAVRPEDYETLDEMIEGLLKILENRINEKGIAHSIVSLIERKMNKVKHYVEK